MWSGSSKQEVCGCGSMAERSLGLTTMSTSLSNGKLFPKSSSAFPLSNSPCQMTSLRSASCCGHQMAGRSTCTPSHLPTTGRGGRLGRRLTDPIVRILQRVSRWDRFSTGPFRASALNCSLHTTAATRLEVVIVGTWLCWPAGSASNCRRPLDVSTFSPDRAGRGRRQDSASCHGDRQSLSAPPTEGGLLDQSKMRIRLWWESPEQAAKEL